MSRNHLIIFLAIVVILTFSALEWSPFSPSSEDGRKALEERILKLPKQGGFHDFDEKEIIQSPAVNLIKFVKISEREEEEEEQDFDSPKGSKLRLSFAFFRPLVDRTYDMKYLAQIESLDEGYLQLHDFSLSKRIPNQISPDEADSILNYFESSKKIPEAFRGADRIFVKKGQRLKISGWIFFKKTEKGWKAKDIVCEELDECDAKVYNYIFQRE